MRITNVTVELYEYPLTRAIGDVNLPDGAETNTEMAVTVHTDTELSGCSIGLPGAAAALKGFAEMLRGRDPREVRSHWHTMNAVAFKMGNAGAVKGAIAALDCALWDLRAKANGLPLWRELGGSEGRCPAYASGLDTPLSDEDLGAFYRSMAAQGISAGKLKVGRDQEDDLRRLAIVADALSTSGKPPVLMVDANEYWSPKQAVQRVAAMERSWELAWVEEPVRRHDYTGLRQVSRGIRAPVATGENLNVAPEYVPLLVNEAVDVVQIGVLTSGITGALQVAELAAAFERPVTMSNCPGRVMAHVAAVLPHHTLMEVIDAGRDTVLVSQPPVVDGHIVLGDEPGTGIVFSSEAMDKHRVERAGSAGLANVYRRAPDAGLVG